MTRGRGFGLWLVYCGLVLQAVGLGCDALFHHQDPTLSQRESTIGFDSLSHLTIVLGLAMLLTGIALVMLGNRSLSRSLPRARLLAFAPGAVLTVALVVTGAASMASGGIPTTHNHSGDGHAHAGDDGHHHDDPETLLAQNPTAVLLRQVIYKDGTEAALAKLQQLADGDRAVLEQSHSLTHLIGRVSFERYGSAAVAFQHCNQTFESGCYHGVLEGYLKNSQSLKPADVATLCDLAAAGEDERANLRFQCVHGMGHGLSLYFNHDLNRTLTNCDYLRSEWDRSSCYGGAFMENIVAARELTLAGGVGTAGPALRSYLHPEDPLYPCNAVADKYQSACYFLQSSAFLLLNGQDFKAAFNKCDRVPARHIWICYQSLGRDVDSAVLWDPAKALELCNQGNPLYVDNCYAGVVSNLIGVDWQLDRAFQFCGLVPESGKPACYTSVGYQVAVLNSSDADRERACAGSGAAYAAVCLSAARAYSTS